MHLFWSSGVSNFQFLPFLYKMKENREQAPCNNKALTHFRGNTDF